MPYNVSRSAQFLEKEVLKFGAPGLDSIRSVVLDANSFPQPTDGSRNVIPAGTILQLSATAPTKYAAYSSGAACRTIQGVLAHSVEILASATAGDEAAPMFYHQCVFATAAIVGFTAALSGVTAITAVLSTCKFE